MVMQQGARAFDPSTKVGKQMIETMQVHTSLSTPEIEQILIDYMIYMNLTDPHFGVLSIYVIRWDVATIDDCISIGIKA